MKEIRLANVYIKNFRSYFHESVSFPNTTGLKLFSGQNLSEQRLGSNGSGKSSLFESIVWCLYGSGVRGARTSSILSWGQNLVEVLVELQVNATLHSIYRCGPPNRIELDGTLVTQEQIDELIGLSKEKFLHSVVFGQSAPLFPDISVPERGALLDDVLGLFIWQKACELASKKTTEFEKLLSEKKSDLAYTEGQLNQLQSIEYISTQMKCFEEKKQDEIDSCKQSLQKWDEQKENRLNEVQLQIEQWKEERTNELAGRVEELTNLDREIVNLEALIMQIEPLDTKENEHVVRKIEDELVISRQKYTKLETELSLTVKPRDFWIQNNNCPTCLQPITEDQKQLQLGEIEKQEQDLTTNLDTASNSIEYLKTHLEEQKNLLILLQTESIQRIEQKKSYEREKKKLETQVAAIEQTSNTMLKELQEEKHPFVKQLKSVTTELNPYISQLKQIEFRINPFVSLLENTKKEKENLQNKKKFITDEITQFEKSIIATEYWKNGFKRIRLFFIDQILSVLEIEIQSAISALGLVGWHVKLLTETETKSGTTKLGIQIKAKSPEKMVDDVTVALDREQIQNRNLEDYSGGELQRLRIAISLGLGNLIQRASGCFYSFSVFDEASHGLSSEGVEDLLDCLSNYATNNNKAVWVVDHTAMNASSFDEVWTVTKTEEGSKVSLVSV